MMRYIIWPEGEPTKAVEARSLPRKWWLEWWMGMTTWRRTVTYSGPSPDNMTPADVAAIIEAEWP